MDARSKKNRQVRPGRTEKSLKYRRQNGKVSVVYYLYRNRQLEHPHFIEVPLSSRNGLYLRDVIERLNVLRGRGMSSVYSWSCKRSYKNGFVWHDLCEDDLILPSHGNEYVLIGSELVEESNLDHIGLVGNTKMLNTEPGSSRSNDDSSSSYSMNGKEHKHSQEDHVGLVRDTKTQNTGQVTEPGPSRSNDDSFSSYSMNGKEHKHSQEDHMAHVGDIKTQNTDQLTEPGLSNDDSSSSYSLNGKEYKHSQEGSLSHPTQPSGSSGASPVSKDIKSSCDSSLKLTDCKVCKSDCLANASTQMDDKVSRNEARETCTWGVSTNDGSLEPEHNENYLVPQVTNNSDICLDTVSLPPSSSKPPSSGGKTATLESLIRAEASKINSFRIIQEEDMRIPSYVKLKATNALLQLISCGSITVKDHNFGLVPTYRPRFSHSKFPSPFLSTSLMLRELDDFSENPQMMGLRLEDRKYFSGSLIEAKMPKEDRNGAATLKRSSSYNADRTIKESDSTDNREVTSSGRSEGKPQSIKSPLNKQLKSGSMCLSAPNGPNNSTSGVDSTETSPSCSSNRRNKMIVDPSSPKEERVTKIEERLSSGARVIIQSNLVSNAVVRSWD